jgi:hypothetical protein
MMQLLTAAALQILFILAALLKVAQKPASRSCFEELKA